MAPPTSSVTSASNDHEPGKELRVHVDDNQDQLDGSVGPRDQPEVTARLGPDQHQLASTEPSARTQRIKTTGKEIVMFSERALMALIGSGLAATVLTALMLADGSSWPRALVVGLGAGGAVLLGIVTLVGRGGGER